MKKIKGSGWYFAMVCECEYINPVICGVFSTKKEAEVMLNDPELKNCPAKHKIKRCRVTIET